MISTVHCAVHESQAGYIRCEVGTEESVQLRCHHDDEAVWTRVKAGKGVQEAMCVPAGLVSVEGWGQAQPNPSAYVSQTCCNIVACEQTTRETGTCQSTDQKPQLRDDRHRFVVTQASSGPRPSPIFWLSHPLRHYSPCPHLPAGGRGGDRGRRGSAAASETKPI
jgi:hypothetical protein